MKKILTLLLCLSSLLLFAQPRKGDFFFGVSSLDLNREAGANDNPSITFEPVQSTRTFSPEFGMMLSDKFLAGARISVFNTVITDPFSDFRNTQLAFSAFGTYFFSRRRVTPFLSTGFLHLGKSNFNGSESTFQWNVRPGLAFYITENTAVELGWNILLFNKRGQPDNWLPDNLRPNFGLTLRQYLFRNREGVEALAAREFIRSGVSLLRAGGNYAKSDLVRNFFLNVGGSYFFADGIYGSLAFNYQNVDFSQNALSDFSVRGADVNLGYYIPTGDDRFYLPVEMQAGTSSRKNGLIFLLSSTPTVSGNSETKQRYVGGRAGIGMFLGRHKIEPSFQWRKYRTAIPDISEALVTYSNVRLALEHEFFLSERLSLNTFLSYEPNFETVNFFFVENPFQIPSTTVEISRNKVNVTGFSVGFKWYLRGSN